MFKHAITFDVDGSIVKIWSDDEEWPGQESDGLFYVFEHNRKLGPEELEMLVGAVENETTVTGVQRKYPIRFKANSVGGYDFELIGPPWPVRGFSSDVGLYVSDNLEMGLGDFMGFTPTYDGDGNLVDISPPSQNFLYAHLTMSSASGKNPPRIPADNATAVQIDVKLTAVDDINAPALPITDEWLVEVRRTGTDLYDNRLASIEGGEGSFTFASGIATDWEIRESDFDEIEAGGQIYKVLLRVHPEQPAKVPQGVARIYVYQE